MPTPRSGIITIPLTERDQRAIDSVFPDERPARIQEIATSKLRAWFPYRQPPAVYTPPVLTPDGEISAVVLLTDFQEAEIGEYCAPVALPPHTRDFVMPVAAPLRFPRSPAEIPATAPTITRRHFARERIACLGAPDLIEAMRRTS